MVLFFFPDALEGHLVRFLIDETPSIGIPLRPAVILRVVNLGAFSDCSVSVSITFRRISGHIFSPIFWSLI